MDNRSSISNSDRGGVLPVEADSLAAWRGVPLAGIIALLALVLIDASLGSGSFPWSEVVPRVKPVQSVYWGVARDRAELARLDSAPASARRVVVMGSSRGHTGFREEMAAAAMPDVVFAKLAHALQDPVTIHALMPEVIAAGIDVLVLPMSHMDTHRPIRLEPLPAKSTSRMATMLDLIDATGVDFAVENREPMYRVALAGVSNLYRFRDSLGRSGINAAREFTLDARLEGKRGVLLRGPPVLGKPSPTRLRPELEQGLLSPLPERQRSWVYQLAWFAEARKGLHADIQMNLLRDIVRDVREAGASVLLVECPVHPIGKVLEGQSAEAQFHQLARELANDRGVWFHPLSASPRYWLDDFDDLFHLNDVGGTRFTQTILELLPAALSPEASD